VQAKNYIGEAKKGKSGGKEKTHLKSTVKIIKAVDSLGV